MCGLAGRKFEGAKGRGSPRPDLPSSPPEPVEGAVGGGRSSPAPTHPALPLTPEPGAVAAGEPGANPAGGPRPPPGSRPAPLLASSRLDSPPPSAPLPPPPLPWQPRDPPGARPPARPPAGALGSGGCSSDSSSAPCAPDPEPAPRPWPGCGPQRAPGPGPRAGRPLAPWSCWPQLSAPPALWTTTAPPRRATRATRRRDTCPAGEDKPAPGPARRPRVPLAPARAPLPPVAFAPWAPSSLTPPRPLSCPHPNGVSDESQPGR